MIRNDLDQYRVRKWRLTPRLRIQSESDAVRFIKDVGFCLLFACRNIPLPKLSQAVQSEDWDWWEWKDTLQAQKKWYNSRVIKKKATLISMELLPCFLSLYYESGGCEVYEEEYYYGKLTEPAYRIADYLFTHGPTSVDDLRKTLAHPGKIGTRKFHESLKELQMKFKVAVSDLEDKHWGVRVMELFSRWAPKEILLQADTLKPPFARQRILEKFISTAGLSTDKEIVQLFGWSPDSVQSTLQQLLRSQSIRTATWRNQAKVLYTTLSLCDR